MPGHGGKSRGHLTALHQVVAGYTDGRERRGGKREYNHGNSPSLKKHLMLLTPTMTSENTPTVLCMCKVTCNVGPRTVPVTESTVMKEGLVETPCQCTLL